MNDYILNITLAKGSGEYCICTCPIETSTAILLTTHDSRLTFACDTAHILAPFAHARYPLVDRISELKIPVVFVCASIMLLPFYAFELG